MQLIEYCSSDEDASWEGSGPVVVGLRFVVVLCVSFCVADGVSTCCCFSFWLFFFWWLVPGDRSGIG